MRCFIAIDIDEKMRNAIADLQKQIAAKVDIKKGDVKWVEPDNIHLTLKFLGEIEDKQLADVCEISKQVAEAHKNFTLDIETVGTFGGRSAKVVWVGAGKGADELLALQKDLEGRLEQAGYPKEEREFSAHLTLCRVRNPKAGFKLADACKAFADYKLGSISADALCIYQSQLTPAGPIYTLLASYKLTELRI
ncbi:MAG: RNA 2',3'-cyclic phosphodiesterase [Sedimentisphaerales bacterium]|nr:RNA 2',3'-cyclic phosphodiesterase [Sedimentisphaerales bacterium]